LKLTVEESREVENIEDLVEITIEKEYILVDEEDLQECQHD